MSLRDTTCRSNPGDFRKEAPKSGRLFNGARLHKKVIGNVIKYPEVLSQKISDQKTECLLKIFVPKDLVYFDGHFPGAPVLPGVVQIDWAIRLSAFYLNIDQKKITGIPQSKFTRVILPDTILFLSLIRSDNKVGFRYFDDDQVYSTGVFAI